MGCAIMGCAIIMGCALFAGCAGITGCAPTIGCAIYVMKEQRKKDTPKSYIFEATYATVLVMHQPRAPRTHARTKLSSHDKLSTKHAIGSPLTRFR